MYAVRLAVCSAKYRHGSISAMEPEGHAIPADVPHVSACCAGHSSARPPSQPGLTEHPIWCQGPLPVCKQQPVREMGSVCQQHGSAGQQLSVLGGGTIRPPVGPLASCCYALSMRHWLGSNMSAKQWGADHRIATSQLHHTTHCNILPGM